jgi:hypothetical protein
LAASVLIRALLRGGKVFSNAQARELGAMTLL